MQEHVTWLQENSHKIEEDDVIDELDALPLEDCDVLENEINKMKVYFCQFYDLKAENLVI